MKEIWKDVVGYERLYKVSNLGNVWSTRSNRLMTPYLGRGYKRVCFSYNNREVNMSIARLVATHFIPNPFKKKEVNHKNGVKTDDKFSNLEWVTHKENINHADSTELRIIYGEYNRNNKLTWDDVAVIRFMRGSMEQRDLANYFRVARSLIHRIQVNKSWIYDKRGRK